MTSLRGVFAGMVVLAVALTPLAIAHHEVLAWVAVFALPIVLLVLIARRGVLSPISPTGVVVVAFALTGAAGLAFSSSIGNAGGVSARIALTPDLASRTAVLLVVSALCVLAGSAVVVLGAPGHRGRSWTDAVLGMVPGTGTLQTPWTLLAGSSLPLLVSLATGGTRILERDSYLIDSSGAIGGLASTLGLGAVVVCGYVAGAAPARSLRTAGILLAAGYLVLYFALGSRRVALVAVVFAAGVVLARPTRSSAGVLVVGGLVSFLLLPVPLYLRGAADHGLLPYLSYLPGIVDVRDPYRGVVDNVLFSFPLAGVVAFSSSPIPLGTLLAEISPLPGGASGWYEVGASLRVNAYTPFSTVGEAGNHGWGFAAGFWFVLGLGLGYLDRRIVTLSDLGRKAPAIVLTGAALLFVLLALQYNLRTSTRLVFYVLLFELTLRVADGLRERRRLTVDPVVGRLGSRRPVPR